MRALNLSIFQLEANCAELKSDLGALHQQLNQEIGTKGTMETVLAESREETFKQRQTSEELAQELEYLKNEINKIKYVLVLTKYFKQQRPGYKIYFHFVAQIFCDIWI